MWGRTALLFTALVIVSGNNRDNDPVVTVKQGELKGSVRNLLDGTPYYSFQGVPYAEPPVGQLRFQAPRPPISWSGIRDAKNHGPNCPQFDWDIDEYIEGSEDCLHLNIYTKSLKSKVPVMFYIHGGAWTSGSGDIDTYGPEFLLQHDDVILITINYRLEVLGFLSVDTPEVPGNAGIKDQVAALKWVKENIALFGGDPDNVTIFGESSGSDAVSFHIISPMSKGLFHKAIAQSGVNIFDGSNTSSAKERAFRVGKLLGKDTTNVDELLQFLRSVPAIKLTKISTNTSTDDEKNRGLPIYFTPVVEKKFKNVPAFINDEPINYLLQNKVNAVPLVIGYNSAEGLIMLQEQLNKTKIMNKRPDYYVPREIFDKVPEQKVKEMGQRIKANYTNGTELGNDTAEGIINLQTDLHFAYDIHRFAYLYTKAGQPIYMYRFEYESDLNILKTFNNLTEYKGACHADDLFYLFCNTLNRDLYTEQENLQRLVHSFIKLWVDFARTGNPTPSNKPVSWKQYTSSEKEFLALNEVMTNEKYADKDRIEFWNQLFKEAGLPYMS